MSNAQPAPPPPGRNVWNFSAGPGVMPLPVLEQAARELPNWNNSGMSVMELSHRSPEFESILADAERQFRQLLDIPPTHAVLWMQGGATTQFSSVVYNLFPGKDTGKVGDYIVTGGWSEKAMQEAQRLGVPVNAVINTKKTNHDGNVPPTAEWNFTPAEKAAYVYYCDNETVHGVEFPVPEGCDVARPPAGIDPSVPVICDMSSNILSRRIDVSKYAVIFAGAQKNIGPAGVTVVIIRRDLIGNAQNVNHTLTVPLMLDFKTYADNNSMYNTPPTYAIYISNLVFHWLLTTVGGLPAMQQLNHQKSTLLYTAIDASEGFYTCPVNRTWRSRMNVPFRVNDPATGKPSEGLEKEFAKRAEERRMVQLKGHRSVGGMRASLYNAMSLEGVRALVAFMEEFRKEHAK
ncbi:pyridoxal phosphate-dependent transferase [Fimicolochytrium jonesii]|uniref:pyridoxal phosphate-dependent transferase n=1 Tax=Fimicolochytrium jonesii TaxID=1396493 RepID=UPI0022FE49F3|nr:pyridoxal phosphate-dependent transferase [Fimicolochytrium jonesii]KAI8821017.1 pyridoxal phosphate-dependent transferase [Fimicolochytrium jonesii]